MISQLDLKALWLAYLYCNMFFLLLESCIVCQLNHSSVCYNKGPDAHISSATSLVSNT